MNVIHCAYVECIHTLMPITQLDNAYSKLLEQKKV